MQFRGHTTWTGDGGAVCACFSAAERVTPAGIQADTPRHGCLRTVTDALTASRTVSSASVVLGRGAAEGAPS